MSTYVINEHARVCIQETIRNVMNEQQSKIDVLHVPTYYEIVIQDYYPDHKPWLSGNFTDIRDLIAVDNVTNSRPTTALVTLYASDLQNLTLIENMCMKQTMYIIPIEWVRCIATHDERFVLMPFNFCCREVLRQGDTRMVRCQLLKLEPEYLIDETFFHVGCVPCNPESSLIQVFADLPLHAGIRNLMKTLKSYDFQNPAEMLYALGRYEKKLRYYREGEKNEVEEKVESVHELVLYQGCYIKKYLAHIPVCKSCYEYL